MSRLSLVIRELSNEVAIIEASGELDAETYEEMESKIGELFNKGIYKLICDLKNIEYMSSAGAGVFLKALDTASEYGGNIVLLQPSEFVSDLFTNLGLDQIIPFTSSLDEAMDAFN